MKHNCQLVNNKNLKYIEEVDVMYPRLIFFYRKLILMSYENLCGRKLKSWEFKTGRKRAYEFFKGKLFLQIIDSTENLVGSEFLDIINQKIKEYEKNKCK